MLLRILFLFSLALNFIALPMVEASPQLSADRFAIHTDAASGEKKLRLVLDLSEPLQPNASLSGQELNIDLKGATLKSNGGSKNLDGRIALSRTLTASSNGVRLNIKLAE